MLMTDISNYIELHGRISLLELARHFNLQESVVQQMLRFWIKKGKVRLVDDTSPHCDINKSNTNKKCTSCSDCNTNSNEIYIWNRD